MISGFKWLFAWRYLAAVAFTGMAYGVRAGLQPVVGDRARVVLFTLAVMASAWSGGLGPGLLATVLSLLIAMIAIFEPLGLASWMKPADAITLLLLAITGVAISVLCEMLHRNKRRLEDEIAQRRQAETALRESEARFKAFMDRAPSLAFIKDQAGRYVYVNKPWEDLYARPWRGRTDGEIWPGEHAAMFSESDRRALEAGEVIEAQETVPDKDGRSQDWWVMKFPLPDADGKILLGGMALDVTARNRAERERATLQTAIERQMEGLALLDAQGRYLYVNPAHAAIYGYRVDELIGQSWKILYAPEQAEALERDYFPILFETGHWRGELVGRKKNGDSFYQEIRLTRMAASDGDAGAVSFTCACRDISAEKLKQQELAETYLALSHAMPGIARLDTVGRYLAVNEMYAGMLGYEAAELLGTDWAATVDQDDRPRALASYERMIETGQGEFEARGLRKDGSLFFKQVLMVKVVDQEGRHIGHHCFMRDVTARKNVELALLESENKLRRVINAIPGAVYQYRLGADGQQGFLSVSDGIEELIGHPAPAVAQNFSLLWDAVLDEDKQALIDSIQRSAETMIPWEFDGRVEQPDGSVKWLRGHSVPEPRRADGSIVWNGILTDVTERKRIELEIARLAAIVENSGDAIVSRGLDLTVQSWNRAAERLFGYTAAEAIGRHIDFIVPDELRDEVAQNRAVLNRGERVSSHDAVRLARGGKRIDVSVTQSPVFDAQGQVIAVSISFRDITERRRAELALRASEERYARATAAGQVGVWEIDFQTGVYQSDKNLKAMFGYAPDELDPDPYRWLALVHPEDQAVAMAETDAVLAGRSEKYRCELRIICKDGSVKWTAVRGDVERADDGRAVRLSGTTVDVTARSLAEQAIRASEQSIRRLYEITNDRQLSSDERVRELLEFGCTRFGIANGAVTHMIGDGLELSYAHSKEGRIAAGMKIPLPVAFCSEVMKSDRPLCCEHIGQSPWRDHPGYSALNIECYIGTKLTVDGQVYGTLCFLDGEPRADTFTEAESDFLRLMAVWIGGELERLQARRQLEESRDRIRQIIDTDPNFIFAKDREGRFTLVNHAMADAYGFMPEQLIGKTGADFNRDAEELARFRKIDLEIMDTLTELYIAEEKFTDSNGKVRWLQTTKRPIVDDHGRVSQVLGVATDITARKLGEEALRQSEQHLLAAQSIAHLGSWEWNFQTGQFTWSDENYRLFGYEPGAVEPSYNIWIDRIHPNDRQRVQEHLSAAFFGSSLCDIEYRVIHPNGDLRWLHWRGELFRDGEGNELRLAGTVLDITERKRAEEALRQAHDELELRVEQRTVQLQQAVDVAGLGIFERDHISGAGYYSPTLLRILDLPEDYHGGVGGFASRVHPEDRAMLDIHRRRAHHPSGHGQMSLEHRILRTDGSVGWILNRAQTFFAGAGDERHHARTVGVVLDITERKRAEEALRKQEEWLNQAVTVADLGIFEHDFVTDEMTFSATFRRMLDWPEDLAPSSQEFQNRLHPEDVEAVRAQIHQAHQSLDGKLALEYRVVRRDGSIGWLLVRSQYFHESGDARRRLVRGVGAALDITERKRAEEALRTSEERLQHALAVGRMGTWERDLRSGVSRWDEHVVDMCGIGADDTISRSWFMAHVHPADLPVLREASRKSEVDGQDSECEFRFVRPDGKMIWLVTHFGPRFDALGAMTHIDGINYDISERKAAEESLRKLNQQLDRRVAERTQDLAESRAGLRALVAQLTMTEERERRRIAVELHDTLAQSLAVVNMYLWRVRELLGEQAQAASMAEVLASLDRIVDESVKYTRSLIAELSPPVLYDLGLPAAFAWLGEQMGRHGLRVNIDGPTEDFVPSQSDAVFLFQCARELLWNVVKHGATDSATLAYGRDGKRLSLAVADQGKGFDLQAVNGNGNGANHFGLFSIRERVALRGGSMEISSKPGIGTWVSLVMPMEMLDRVAVKPLTPAVRAGVLAPVDDRSIKIIIVDDHKMLRQGLRRVLEEHTGFEVVGEAGDGAEAVALAREIAPRVVIMDVNMPTMNGIEATQEIVHERPSTIVIGVSFGTDDFVLRAMREAGAVTCLPKERAVEDVSQAILDALAGGTIDNGELRMKN